MRILYWRNGNGITSSNSESVLSKEEISGQIPYLFQWDERWGFKVYYPNNVTNCMKLWEFNSFKDEIKSAWSYGVPQEGMLMVAE